MPPALQRAPEPERASYVYTTSSSGNGGGTVTPPSALTIRLASDGNSRSALHSIILVLPISILIFIEVLRHPDKEIKLPIVDLELEIKTLLPILLLVISYMLYRALRHSRIVLWNILFLPSQVAELAFDSEEAYKVESPPYDETFDRMFVEFRDHQSRVVQWLARFTFTTFNIIRSLAIYGLIFAMLVYIALYLTQELPTVATSIHFDLSRPQWPIGPALALDLLVLGLSILLLGLAWINAGITILAASLIVLGLTFGISYVLAQTIARFIAAIYSARLFAPLRAIFRAAHRLIFWLRQRSRDRRLNKDQQRYERRSDQFRSSSEFAHYQQRLELFLKVDELSRCLEMIDRVMRDDVGQTKFTDSNWWPIVYGSGFVILGHCVDYLKKFAQDAPLDEVRRRYEELKPFVDAFSPRADEPLLDAMRRWRELNSAESKRTVIDLRAWLSSIPPKLDELRKMDEEWQVLLKTKNQNGVTLSGKESWRLGREASIYFASSALDNAGFKVPKPVRGSHDWRMVSYLINTLAGLGQGITDTKTPLS
jgi:hypothetical protein